MAGGMASTQLLILFMLTTLCAGCSKSPTKNIVEVQEAVADADADAKGEANDGGCHFNRPSWIGEPGVHRRSSPVNFGYSVAWVTWHGLLKNDHCVEKYFIEIDSITARRTLQYYDTAALRRRDPDYELELRNEAKSKLHRILENNSRDNYYRLKGLQDAPSEYVITVIAVEKRGIRFKSPRIHYCSGNVDGNCTSVTLNDRMYMPHNCWKVEYEAEQEQIRVNVIFDRE